MQNLSTEEMQARGRQHLPERAVPVRARRGLAARQSGRLSAAAAAAGQLRCALRQRAEPSAGATVTNWQYGQELGAGGSSSAAPADIAVLGAGSWGTALAIQCARAGRPARLWGRDARACRGDGARARQPALSAGGAVSRVACNCRRLTGRSARGRRGRADRGAESRLSRAADRTQAAAAERDAAVLGDQGLRARQRQAAQ